MKNKILNQIIIVRGAGEMASGVIHRLHKSNFVVIVLEQSKPVCVRRQVCFANAVFEKNMVVEGVQAVLADNLDDTLMAISNNNIPILIDPECLIIDRIKPVAIIDCRMLKKEFYPKNKNAPIIIGLGPGFEAKVDCHAVVETNRGNNLGKAIYSGNAEDYTGIPAEVNDYTDERVLRAPANGNFISYFRIGDIVKTGDEVGKINSISVVSQINGVVRGLIHKSVDVRIGQKIGDIDPRGNKNICLKISDKAAAIANGVLESLRCLGVNN